MGCVGGMLDTSRLEVNDAGAFVDVRLGLADFFSSRAATWYADDLCWTSSNETRYLVYPLDETFCLKKCVCYFEFSYITTGY